MKFKKGEFIPQENPFGSGERQDSSAWFDCDVDLEPSDFGFDLFPSRPMENNEALIRCTNYGAFPYWIDLVHCHVSEYR